MKTIKGDLVLTENTTFEDDLKVKGNVRCEGGYWNITARDITARDINAWDINAGNINAWDINAGNITARDINATNITAWNITARDINAGNINAWNITARDINAWDINAGNINAWDINAGNITAREISYYAFCIAYGKITCKKIAGRRENSFHKCLDGKLIIRKQTRAKEKEDGEK